MPPYLVHYLGTDGVFPTCSARGGVSPNPLEVTCPRCRASVRFCVDDARRAIRALWRALWRRS